MNIQTLYEKDFNSWIQAHIALLKDSRFSEMDVNHLIQELEDMGKSNRDALESRLVVLMAHLLKWQYQPDGRSSSWIGSIKEQRRKLLLLLKKNPSLKNCIDEAMQTSYVDAIEWAVDETNLPETCFPAQCPYTQEQLLNKDFYP